MAADSTTFPIRGHGRPGGLAGLIGESPEMRAIHVLIEKVSHHTFPVLILGESGTGKELVARGIHDLGPRAGNHFTPVDCSAFSDALIESELFGHTRGSFTGATCTTTGLFQASHKGTIFLDEIGELPVHLQPKLLRVMQEGVVRSIGSTTQFPIDVRVIAATNRDMESAITSGTFRRDLYFRLNVVEIHMPPLRKRRSDIPLLVNYFLQKFASAYGGARTVFDDAMRRLCSYDWPGNVRELENAIEQALALGSTSVVRLQDLPAAVQNIPSIDPKCGDDSLYLAKLERSAIFRAVQETSGDKLAAARLLGIGKTTLYRKLKTYGESRPNS